MSNSNVNQTFTLKILLRILNRQKKFKYLKTIIFDCLVSWSEYKWPKAKTFSESL